MQAVVAIRIYRRVSLMCAIKKAEFLQARVLSDRKEGCGHFDVHRVALTDAFEYRKQLDAKVSRFFSGLGAFF